MTLFRTAFITLALSCATSCRHAHPQPLHAPPGTAGSRARSGPPVLHVSSFSFDRDDSELMPLADWIGDAEMVLLGEAHHGDAEGITATVRLIRFLHERMGFDVLALEADLYGCARAWEGVLRGEADAARLCTFRKDTLSQASAPFWPWVTERARSERPLQLAGFDCQPSSEGSRAYLIDELRNALGGGIDGATLGRAASALEKLSRYTPRVSTEEREQDRAALTELASALHQLQPSPSLSPERVALLKQLGRSLVADEAQEWELQHSAPFARGYYRSFNQRDAQMAENLLWLRAQHPGRKIVVWAATPHLVRSLASVPTDARDEAPLFVPMGQHVARAMGPRAVHIGALNAEGMVGLPDAEPFALPPAPAGFIEDELKKRGFGARSIIDLRQPSDETSWLRAPRPARWHLTKRPAPAAPERAMDVVDMILFLEQTRPNRASERSGATSAR